MKTTSKYSQLTPEQKKRHSESVCRWQKRNAEKANAKAKAWCDANPEKRKEVRDAWKQRNRSSVAEGKARRRGIDWNLTPEQYEEITSKPCHYCAGSLPKTYGGLDRIDNSKGYEPTNVLPCCTQCNITRNAFYTVEEMKVMITVLFKFRSGEDY